jgi:CDP-diacylglycerol--glycerol-3-phosphate 3-phosphatidyltransferase
MWLTMSRMLLAAVMMSTMQFISPPWNGWISAAIFIFAALTDWWDGYFARRWNATSNMGKFMDPIADKVLVSTTLIILIPDGRVHPFLVVLLLNRDILIGGLRSVAAAEQLIIDAKPSGKWKTAVQMSAIPVLLVGPPNLGGVPITDIAHVVLWLSAGLSLYSAWEYLQLYRSRQRKGRSSST